MNVSHYFVYLFLYTISLKWGVLNRKWSGRHLAVLVEEERNTMLWRDPVFSVLAFQDISRPLSRNKQWQNVPRTTLSPLVPLPKSLHSCVSTVWQLFSSMHCSNQLFTMRPQQKTHWARLDCPVHRGWCVAAGRSFSWVSLRLSPRWGPWFAKCLG